MSRSGYSEDCDDQWAMIRWRGAVSSAFRGKKGQAFLKEILDALDEMPVKRLVTQELEKEGDFCTLGALGHKRGIDMSETDPEDYWSVANLFDVNEKLIQEIVYMNDEYFSWGYVNEKYQKLSPEDLWTKMRAWIASKIK